MSRGFCISNVSIRKQTTEERQQADVMSKVRGFYCFKKLLASIASTLAVVASVFVFLEGAA